MVLNMMCSAEAGTTIKQWHTFSVSSGIVYPDPLVVTGIDIPGGTVNGMILVCRNTASNALVDGQILSMYSDPSVTAVKSISYDYYSAANNSLIVSNGATSAFNYDESTQTLHIPILDSGLNISPGSYALLVW